MTEPTAQPEIPDEARLKHQMEEVVRVSEDLIACYQCLTMLEVIETKATERQLKATRLLSDAVQNLMAHTASIRDLLYGQMQGNPHYSLLNSVVHGSWPEHLRPIRESALQLASRLNAAHALLQLQLIESVMETGASNQWTIVVETLTPDRVHELRDLLPKLRSVLARTREAVERVSQEEQIADQAPLPKLPGWTKEDAEPLVRAILLRSQLDQRIPTLREIESMTGISDSTISRTDAWKTLGASRRKRTIVHQGLAEGNATSR